MNRAITGIRFTVEVEQDGQLPFLDILVKRTSSGSLDTQVYRKGTHTDQVLSLTSNHPRQHKVSCVKTLFSRIHTHCSTFDSQVAERKYLFGVFQSNGYPRSFIKRCLRKRRLEVPLTQSLEHGGSNERMTVLPYINGVSEVTARILHRYGIKTAHKPVASLRTMLSKPKDTIPVSHKVDAVYRVNCKNCRAVYVGQTGRKLSTRLHEHGLAIKRHDQLSLMSIHQDRFGHTFDLESPSILATARTKCAREFLEAWYSNSNAINRHVNIDPSYHCLKSIISLSDRQFNDHN